MKKHKSKKKNRNRIEKLKKKKVRSPFNWRKYKTLMIILGAVFVFIIAFFIVLKIFTVDTVTIEGNIHYTNEEIQEMVLGGKLGHNSIYLAMKYKKKEIKDIPFIEAMDVDIVSPHAVKITVYEKVLAGYVEHLGQFFYFDKDGMVVESSNVRTMGIPQILGLKFHYIVLYEKLPVDDDTIFNQILDVTQLLNKYGIKMDKIYFDKNYNITLYFGDARVKLGNTDYIDEKIMRLKSILPQLEGKKGVLQMENFTIEQENITFELDKEIE